MARFRIDWTVYSVITGADPWAAAEELAQEIHAKSPSPMREAGALYDGRSPDVRLQMWCGDQPLIPADYFRRLSLEATELYHQRSDRLGLRDNRRDLETMVRFGVGGKALVDIAHKLAVIGGHRGIAAVSDGETLRYQNANDADWIDFRRRGESVVLSWSRNPGHELIVPIKVFTAGVQRFLNEVATTIAQRAPSLMQLEALADLREFVGPNGMHANAKKGSQTE